MFDLTFAVVGAEPVPFAVAPALALEVRIADAAGRDVHAIALRCQLQIDAAARAYGDAERTALREVFGDRAMKPLLWTHVDVNVPRFSGSVAIDLIVPCSYDLSASATKYFHALGGGEVPLTLLFSGTIFYEGEGGGLQIARVPWSREAAYRLPVQVWRRMMEIHYPDSTFVALRNDVVDRLHRYRASRGLPTLDQALEALFELGGGE